MSNKEVCPGCGSYTSRVYDAAYGDAAACSHCGLAGTVIRAVLDAQESKANQDLKVQFEEMAVRAGKAEEEAARLRRMLGKVRSALVDERE